MNQQRILSRVRQKLCLMLAGMLLSVVAHAQQRSVTGTVTDNTGETMPGVNVVIKGTSTGVVTDINGKFAINVPGGDAVLTVSFIGYTPQDITVGAQTVINVTLAESVTELAGAEIVATGYGAARSRDLTGAIASVNEKALKDIPVTSALTAMTGKMAGVHVVVTEGSPDADIKVRVRAGGSITQDNSPLYIVDGFIVRNINHIPPTDIQSIDVLKDAASTAIYGAQGANGVILVTTKSGREGKATVSVNSFVGLSKTYNLTDVLSPYDFVYYQREIDPSTSSSTFNSMYGAWEDIGVYKSMEGIDWQKEVYGNTGVQKNINVSVTGGDESIRYNVSYTHDDNKYIMFNSNYKRDNISAKISKSIGKSLDFDLTARTVRTEIDGPSISDGRKLRDAIKFAPVKSLATLSVQALDPTAPPTEVEASLLNDPIYNIQNEYKKQKELVTTFQAGATWKIIEGLTYRVQGSYAFENANTDNIWLKRTGESAANGGMPVSKRQTWDGNRWSIQNILTYNFKIAEDHAFTALLGQEANHSRRDETLIQAKFYPETFTEDDVLAMWNQGTSQPTYTTIGEPSRTSSIFGRVNYQFKQRYLLGLTLRRDGTSVFAPGKKWGFFPAASAGWIFSEESFMDTTSDWLSFGKLRLSWGSVGNARVGSYWRQDYAPETAPSRLYYVNEAPGSDLRPGSTLKNENLTWESKTSVNAGLDLKFMNDRLSVTLDAYQDVSKDLIIRMNIPTSSGFTYQYQNLGQTTNRGIELTMNYALVEQSDFRVDVGFNIAFNKNRVDKLDGNDILIASSGWGLNTGEADDFRAVVGKSVGQIYGFVSDGMYSFDDFTFNETTRRWAIKEGVPDIAAGVLTNSGSYFGPGHAKFKKLTERESNTLTLTDDRTVIGSTMPIHTGGFNVNASYKGFDLSAVFNWSYGNDVYNANKIDNTIYALTRRFQNVGTEMSIDNRFTTIDPVTGYNIYHGVNADPAKLRALNEGRATIWHPLTNRTFLSDWAIEDGSFLRLNNLTVGYTLPSDLTRKVLISNLRVYVTGYNLFCWTNYTGQDPEVDTRRSNPLTPGVDYSAYPKAHTYVFGINVTF